MSGGLAPSKSTVYVSNLPFSLTNSDLHQIFEKYGKIGRVVIMKDKVTRMNKGVAFILYVERHSAFDAVKALNRKELFGRTLKCSIAKDNGRAADFIKKRFYPDKTKCYECGESGHLSHQCPKNLLGQRDVLKNKKSKKQKQEEKQENEKRLIENLQAWDSDSEGGEDPRLESLSAVIKEESMNTASASTSGVEPSTSEPKSKKFKQNSYFSDEEDVSD